jgi:HPt (histidine-containing phosphotransfer) domain-containing protein
MDPTTSEPDEGSQPGAPPVQVGAFLEQMREVGLESMVDEAFRIYLRDAPARIERLRSALGDADATATESAAHALKSASLNVWAVELARLLEQVESAGGSADLGRASGLFVPVEEEFARVTSFLCGRLAGGG